MHVQAHYKPAAEIIIPVSDAGWHQVGAAGVWHGFLYTVFIYVFFLAFFTRFFPVHGYTGVSHTVKEAARIEQPPLF